MFEYLIYIAVFALFCPAMASRFDKFMPADPATAIVYMFHKPRFTKTKNLSRGKLFINLWRKFLWRSVGFSVVASLCAEMVLRTHYASSYVNWYVLLICFLALLSAIDIRMHILPDLLTVPLMALGMAFAVYGKGINPEESLMGIAVGYGLPVIASVLVYKFAPRGMGGGDVKMLMALGAWLGIERLIIAIVLSFIVFTIISIFTRKKSGPYGPALSIATIIAMSYDFSWIYPLLGW